VKYLVLRKCPTHNVAMKIYITWKSTIELLPQYPSYQGLSKCK